MRILLVILIATSAIACGSTRKQMARAESYEQHDLLKEAHEQYADLHNRKPNEVLARVGMKRTAQGMLDRLQERAITAYNLDDLKAGDRLRDEAMTFKRMMDAKGLNLEPNPAMEAARSRTTQAQASALYAQAASAFGNDQFTEAEDLCTQALRLWPTHRDAEHLQRLARTEPLYREGAIAMEKQLWREAYRKFDQVMSLDPAHKDALAKRTVCLDAASITMACLMVQGGSGSADMISGASESELSAQFLARIKEAVLDAKDPFIILIDRENTERVLAEQRRQMSGAYDEQRIAEAGKLIGARYVLAIRLLRFDDLLAKQLEAQVQLISAETGRIHLSEVVRVNRQEITRGTPRAQLLERASKRIAIRLQEAGAGL